MNDRRAAGGSRIFLARLANISGKEAIKAFGRAGWVQMRQAGSHASLERVGSAVHLCVPLHKELRPGLLRNLISDAGLTVDEFLALL